MREIYLVSGIYEDDFGCEERPADYKPLVVVTLKTHEGKELTMKQPDAWMYEQNIREGDAVILADGRLMKAETPGKRIFCFGDSNTYGYDPRSVFGGRLPKSQRWTDILQDLSGWEILNRGANGRTIPQETWALEEFDRQLAECGPVDLVLIMLGTNDLLNHFRPDMGKVSERMEQFIGHVLSHPVIEGKQDRILLVAPPHTKIGRFGEAEVLYDRESEKSGLYYRAVAQRNGICFADASGWKLPLAHDGVHIAPEGNRIFAEQLWKLLK